MKCGCWNVRKMKCIYADAHIVYSWVLSSVCTVGFCLTLSLYTVGFCLPFVQLGSVFHLYSWVLSSICTVGFCLVRVCVCACVRALGLCWSSAGVVDGGLDGRCCIVVLAANAGLDGRCCIVVLAVAVVLSANAAVLPFNRKQ
jgi:hypothetical protein